MRSLTRRLGRNDGFTIIELLMAIMTGVVVTGALYAILEVSLHQTSRVTDTVQATQLGRIAMTDVVDELHSTCLARKFAPVQEKSTSKELIFINGTGEEALLSSSKVFEHKIYWTGTYLGSGQLLDKSYPATGGSWPNFTFTSSTPTTKILAEYAYNASELGTSKAHEIPIFSYYKYSSEAGAGTSTTPAGSLAAFTPASSGLTAEQAKTTSAVGVTFSVAPTDKNIQLNRPVEFSNLVTLAFATPASEATIEDGPCQ